MGTYREHEGALDATGMRIAIVAGRFNDHITTPREKIAAYADNQLQVKGGVLIGIWDEAELAAIRQQIERRSSPSQFSTL